MTADSPDGKVHGPNMGPIWGRQDPGRPMLAPINFAIWVHLSLSLQVINEQVIDDVDYINGFMRKYFNYTSLLFLAKYNKMINKMTCIH